MNTSISVSADDITQPVEEALAPAMGSPPWALVPCSPAWRLCLAYNPDAS